MTHPSKRKGNGFEREIVNRAIDAGLEAKRAYASNGESLGLHAEVDVLIEKKIKVQAKRRKKIAAHLIPSEHVDCVITRQDHGETLVIMRLDDWLELLNNCDLDRIRENADKWMNP